MKRLLMCVLIAACMLMFFASAYAADDSVLGIVVVDLKDGSQRICSIYKTDLVDSSSQIDSFLKELYNDESIKEIVSLNDTPLKDTPYSKYSGVISHVQDTSKERKRVPGSTPEAANNSQQSGDSITDSSSLKIIINGKRLEFSSSTRPYIKDNRVMVPFRALFEAIGADVGYRTVGKQQILWASSNGIRVELKVGDNRIYRGGKLLFMDVAPEIKNGTVCISLNSAAKMLNMQIAWDPVNNTVSINN